MESLTPVPVPPASVTQDEKTLGIVMHVLCLVGMPILGPLVVWLMKKNARSYLDQQGRELLNFQLTYLLYAFLAALLLFVFIGVVLLPLIAFAVIMLTVMGIVRAAEGKIYRFPLTIRLL
ncbi:MAG TPA: DUF4870 domain-containing protein [Prosthecobacter sp.]